MRYGGSWSSDGSYEAFNSDADAMENAVNISNNTNEGWKDGIPPPGYQADLQLRITGWKPLFGTTSLNGKATIFVPPVKIPEIESVTIWVPGNQQPQEKNNQFPGSNRVVDPSTIAKWTQGFFAWPAVEIEGYSTKTIHSGKSPTEFIINARSLKPESVSISTAIGKLSLGFDGKITFGNGIISAGGTTNGSYILDLSFPTNNTTAIGTTMYYNPQTLINNVNYLLNTLSDAMSKSRIVYPIPFIPGPAPIPSPLIIP